jgi:O-antigen/teichoic acid export membrane protein
VTAQAEHGHGHHTGHSLGRLARGVGLSFAGKTVGRGAFLVGSILMARLLGPAEFGLYAVGYNLARLVGQVSALGLDFGVIRYGARVRADSQEARDVIAQALSTALAVGACAGLLMLACSSFLGTRVFGDPRIDMVIAVLAPAPLLIATLKVAAASSRIEGNMGASVSSEDISQPVFQIAAFLVIYALGYRALGAAVAMLVSYVVSLALAVAFLRRTTGLRLSRSSIRWRPRRELLMYSVISSMASASLIALTWSDKLVLAHFVSVHEVGVYQAVSQLPLAVSAVTLSVSAAFAPMIAASHGSNRRGLSDGYKATSRWGLYLAMPIAPVLIMNPYAVTEALFGSGYQSGAWALRILTIAQIANVGTGSVGTLLVVAGRQKLWFGVAAVSLAVSIAGSVVLSPRYGMTGAAIATASAVAVLYMSGLVAVRRYYALWPFDRSLMPLGISSALAFAGCGLLATSDIAPLAVVAASVAGSCAIIWCAPFIAGSHPDDKALVGSLVARLRGPKTERL